MPRKNRRSLAVVAALLAPALPASLPSSVMAAPIDSSALRSALTVDGIRAHQAALQAIADQNAGTRASGTPGFEASLAYVRDQLKRVGYDVRRQLFTFQLFSEPTPAAFAELTPAARSFVAETEFNTMEYSGAGDVTGPLVPTLDVQLPPGPTPSSSNSGCEAADFPAPPTATAVALVQRGTCTFAVKVENATAAGYAAVVIFNEGQDGRTDAINGTLGGDGFTVPAVGTTFAIGAELVAAAAAGPVSVRVKVDAVVTTTRTANLLAERSFGRNDRVLVVGAHLDSVAEGPGINDNGSGIAANLETAIQLAKLGIKTRNRVRFAFWGAEESGLLGSAYYVGQLSEAEQARIMANLNFDMLGSPNFARLVYDGDGSATPDPEDAGPAGSDTIEKVFLQYFDQQNLPTLPTAFDGRSDYGPFIDVGIPAGGLFSGAEDLKTAEEAALFGGTEGVALDPCYHQACDTYANVSATALDQLGDAAAHAVLHLAQRQVSVRPPPQNLRAARTVQAAGQLYRGNRLVK